MRKLVASVLLLSVLLVSTHAGRDSLLAQGSSSPRPSDEKVFLVFLQQIIEVRVRVKYLRVQVYEAYLDGDITQQKKHQKFFFMRHRAYSLLTLLKSLKLKIIDSEHLKIAFKSKLLDLVKLTLADVKELIQQITIFLSGNSIPPKIRGSNQSNAFNSTSPSMTQCVSLLIGFEKQEIKLNLLSVEAANIILNLLETAIYSSLSFLQLKKMSQETIKELKKEVAKVLIEETTFKKFHFSRQELKILTDLAKKIIQRINSQEKIIINLFIERQIPVYKDQGSKKLRKVTQV